MIKNILLTIIIYLVCISLSDASELKLPSLLGSNMVLQQQSKTALWGWAKAGDPVTVHASWIKKPTKTTTDSNGKWKLFIQTPVAGGPYQIKISSDTTYNLKNIMIGEVWVCSGQSNMQMPFHGYNSQPVLMSNDYISHGNNNDIRLFTVKKELSIIPSDNCQGSWSVSNPHDVGKFSAVAYIFGNYLQEVLNVPVGLIHVSWGGTPIESWTDESTIKSEFNEIDLSLLDRPDEVKASTPTVLFNGMIHPILNYTIRGVIWYQGEANRNRPDQYSKLFPAMIGNWRARWNQGEFPFYFVQIAPYKYDTLVNSAFLREAQLKTLNTTPGTGMAVTMDIGEKESIHPSEKVLVGKRLAYNALAKTYGMTELPYSGPVLKEMIVEGNKATLKFDFSEFGLTSFNKPIEGFTIAGADRSFFPAKVTIKGKDLIVISDQVTSPVAVRYCWGNYAVGTLFNTAGLPASSFRTDSWDK